MNPPPYTDRHGEHWIGSYDTDEEDAIRCRCLEYGHGMSLTLVISSSCPVHKPVESVDDAPST